jgi:hypothetical protein
MRKTATYAMFAGRVCFALMLSALITLFMVSAEAYEANGHMAELLRNSF